MQKTTLDVAATAKLLRAALKRHFPGIKFAVRSERYSMGASIDVAWTDGPTAAMVERISRGYQGSRFDGQIDMSFTVTHWLLPDGSVMVADNPGTEGQRSDQRAEHNAQPHPDAKLVRFAADFVHSYREYSEPFMRQALNRLVRAGVANADDEIVARGTSGALYQDRSVTVAGQREDLSILLHREMQRLMIVRG